MLYPQDWLKHIRSEINRYKDLFNKKIKKNSSYTTASLDLDKSMEKRRIQAIMNVLEKLPELQAEPSDGSVAKLYRLPGALGRVGLISPVSAHFCAECNRIRLTADGRIKPCLHAEAEYSLKGQDYEGMVQTLEKAILSKPKWHGALDAENHSHAGRSMNQIGG